MSTLNPAPINYGYHSPSKIHAILKQDFPGDKVKDMRSTIEVINNETLSEEEWDEFQREFYETDSEDEEWNKKYRPKGRPPRVTQARPKVTTAEEEKADHAGPEPVKVESFAKELVFRHRTHKPDLSTIDPNGVKG